MQIDYFKINITAEWREHFNYAFANRNEEKQSGR